MFRKMTLPRHALKVSLFGCILLLTVALAACSTPAAQPAPTAASSQPTAAATSGGAPAEPTQAPTAATAEPTQTPVQPSPTPTLPPPTPTVTATPAPTEPGIGSKRTVGPDEMEQVFVPAGEFLMGSTDPEAKLTVAGGRAYPEVPQHTVSLESYWIDRFEVTNRQYKLCEEAGACLHPWVPSSNTVEKYYGYPEYENYPVVWVTFYQARDYCAWAGRRLPTEAEWEKASRGTDGQKYPWGEDPVDGTRANFCDRNCTRTIANDKFDDGYKDTAPVGSYPAGESPYGAMDMSGNVWEWVSTLVEPYPYDANDGRESQEGTGERVWRGGPWSNGVWWMRSSVRYRSVPNYKWYVLGFRCASSE